MCIRDSYQIRPGAAPWGDYGDILWNGITEEVPDGNRSVVTVSRTGPFVPPITLPFGHIIVTEEFRKKIAIEKFSGLAFAPVHYRTVVAVDWQGWDRNAADPRFYPDTGEPEDYLRPAAHDAELAAAMPRLWAWNVAATAGLQVHGTNTFRRERHPGADVVREFHIFWINERMKVWLDESAGQWLSFIRAVPG